jgi:hypothetical protein
VHKCIDNVVLKEHFTDISLGCFIFTCTNLNLLAEIIFSRDMLTICGGLVHTIPHIAFTVSIQMGEITTYIEMTKPVIVPLTITNAIVNPYLSHNWSPHDCHCHSAILMYASKARKSSVKTIMLILIALIGRFFGVLCR